MNLYLQRMTHVDLDEYVAIEKRNESRTYTAAQDRKEAAEELEQGPMYFIKLEDVVIGAASYSIKEDGSAYINGLAILPEYQGQGWGKLALQQILLEVKDVPRVWLVTHPENIKAIALYESFGFKTQERIENFHGDGEPRIVLSLERVNKNT